MPAGLSFRGVSKTFHSSNGSVTALTNLDLDIQPNEFVVVVGPSGCGKSTMLHIAAGLDTQYEGEFATGATKLRNAYLFQQPRLLPWSTAQANVAFVLEARGASSSQALATARDYLQLVGLAGFEQVFPNHLSGGMQQRVALARALAVQPELLLMDEPFGAQDELTARRLRTELVQICLNQPRTILFVTHNVTEAAFFADRVIVMSPRPGRVLADIRVELPRSRDYDDPVVATVARDIVNHLQLEER
ncbi:MAG: ABC transporter ATP-binding protein [Chloroflexota bacterium]